MKNRFTLWTTVILATLAQSGAAHAYIDPGAGSMLLQAAVGAIAGGMFVLRTYWARVSAFFNGSTETSSEAGSGETEAPATEQ